MDTNKVLAFVREENRKDLEFVREISPEAWKWAEHYRADLPGPGPNASQDERDGWGAFRRLFTRRPVFVLEELAKLRRQMVQWRNE